MGSHTAAYKVNIHFACEKSQKEIAGAYTQFYVEAVSRMLKSSSLPLEKKNEILDTIIRKHSET